MRIVLAHNLAPWDPRAGGGQRILHNLGDSLARSGHEVRVPYLMPRAEVRGFEIPESLPYDVVPVTEHPRLLRNVVEVAREARRLFRSWSPDAAYTSSPEAAGVGWALPREVGLVASSHHPDPPNLQLPGLLHPMASLARLRQHQAAYLERWLLRKSHRPVATSRFGREALLERGYLPRNTEVGIVRNGVEEIWFTGEAEVSEENGPFLFVGRMDDQKGLDVLLRALARLSEQRRLVAVGGGWKEQEYRRLAEDLGIAHRVDFVGPRPPAEIVALTPGALAMVQPSRSENYPLTLLEGMASGLPVISTTVGGIPEMVSDGVNGILVPPEDPEALAEAMRRLAADPELRAELSAEGRDVAEAHRWPRVAQDLAQELGAAIRAARGGRD